MRWLGLLLGLVATLAGTSPGLGADLQNQLLGDWYRPSPQGFFSTSFSPDGRLTYSAYNRRYREALVNEAQYSLQGSLLTLGVGDSGGGDGWAFGDHVRVACSVTFFPEQMELSNCIGWDRTGQPVELSDTTWLR